MRAGRIRVEKGFRLDRKGDGYKIVPRPCHTIAFIPDDNPQTAFDLGELMNSIFFLLKDRLSDVICDASVDIGITDTPGSCKISFAVEITDPRSESSSNIYSIKFAEPSEERYVFNAQDDLAALRAFLGMFDHLSEQIDAKVLRRFGIESLCRLYPGNQWFDIYPAKDDLNNRCKQVKSCPDQLIS